MLKMLLDELRIYLLKLKEENQNNSTELKMVFDQNLEPSNCC
jgi:hypothetical protein